MKEKNTVERLTRCFYSGSSISQHCPTSTLQPLPAPQSHTTTFRLPTHTYWISDRPIIHTAFWNSQTHTNLHQALLQLSCTGWETAVMTERDRERETYTVYTVQRAASSCSQLYALTSLSELWPPTDIPWVCAWVCWLTSKFLGLLICVGLKFNTNVLTVSPSFQ